MKDVSIFLVSLIVCGLACDIAFSAQKHQCEYCHIPHGMSSELLLKSPPSKLCLECHPDRIGPNEHKTGIIPSMPVRDLPLSSDGKIICITCHDPHSKGDYPKFLRTEPTELCVKCHIK
ncbi:MAG: cytochrome c3 family protein [Nitrospirota bacterium]